MIWTSFRKPFGKSGRIGRSVRRAVRMPSSEGRPSRRGNEPGILPAALPEHADKPAAAGVVVAGGAQMFGEVLDSLGQERDLDLRRAGVLVVTAVRRDHLVLLRERR